MSEDRTPDPLARLGAEIDKARRDRLRQEATGPMAPPQGALGLGFRIAVELVASLCVGLALGWVFDRALGTRPWGLIAFFFLGAAARRRPPAMAAGRRRARRHQPGLADRMAAARHSPLEQFTIHRLIPIHIG